MSAEEPRRSIRWEVASMQATDGAWAERRRLAAAMRRVIEGLVTSDAPEDELSRAADALERYADRLAGHPRRNAYQSWAETSPAGDSASFFDQSPLIGLANPLAPPIALEANETVGKVRGSAVFGSANFTTGELYACDALCAEAEGLFVSVDRSRFAELFAERQARAAKQNG